ncbi:MAG: AAA family ATPase [Deltaproteobacteria bacterium]|nr:AAA family ATPase [Deltaproteobacteria bacterium]
MRIGIVGAAGTGKTNLAKALAAHLGVSVIPDTVLAVLRERGRDSWRGVDAGDRRKIREEALRRKISLEASEPAFVSDKTCVDYLAYWLQNQSETEERHINQAFLDQCKENAATFDVFVYLPYREQVDYAVGRNQDPIHNLKVAAHKRGLLAVLGLPHVEAPYYFGEDMAAWVEKWLKPFDKGAK